MLWKFPLIVASVSSLLHSLLCYIGCLVHWKFPVSCFWYIAWVHWKFLALKGIGSANGNTCSFMLVLNILLQLTR